MDDKEPFSILLVDDDPTIIFLLSRILGEFAPIRFATSGRDALKLARESAPDLVLLDVELPDLSGFEVCKAFKREQALAEVPIMFITSHENPQLEAMGLQMGAVDFITKPPHAPVVLARVRTHYRMKTLSDTLRGAVSMDFLTGTANRRHLEQTLTQEWLRAQRSGASLALLLVDIDDFKAYNEQCGEAAGDSCLKRVADALRSVLQRPGDFLARYAGGKFALLLPETDARGAAALAQRIIRDSDDLNILYVDSLCAARVTLSVGSSCRDPSRVAINSDETDRSSLQLSSATANDLLAAAEQALHVAKGAGGHQSRFAALADLGVAHAAASGN